ncbi:regulatory protein RecX [Fulvivirga sedimenti]|uniref:Regulatory protein RecX n=1 Tax=Fulvivirga sedimenti TaxID=2879465 RepID=A0A9X1HPI8_9BACT|nr:regulatory protein RecX [Fulvivirga sedimenti]MCA6074412.1 recombination regulator RecX [Fulvivirga sedimenti]
MKKELTDQEILEKAASFCAYQERSERDLKNRLYKWDVTGEKAEAIIAQLKEENFLDNKRFALAYVRGRFKLKKWGRIKIRYGLIQHGIDAEIIHEALQQLDDDQYIETLSSLLEARMKRIQNPGYKEKSSAFHYLSSKGYEGDLIADCWDKQYPDY